MTGVGHWKSSRVENQGKSILFFKLQNSVLMKFERRKKNFSCAVQLWKNQNKIGFQNSDRIEKKNFLFKRRSEQCIMI